MAGTHQHDRHHLMSRSRRPPRRRRWSCLAATASRQPAGPENLPAPFHVYSMRQAIEEGFILDVLQNYTSYKLAFKLAHDGKEMDEREVERSAAMKGIMRWVRLHPYNISQKVQIVVEHFRETVQPLLNGHAKAMVVVGQPIGGRALAVCDRQIHQGPRIRASRRWSRSPARCTMRSLARSHSRRPARR